ncbi:Omp28 family outer membrane lipoprotein [bacterium]|nr:Omp28 family outer membrane lipoprotein [bacterium]
MIRKRFSKYPLLGGSILMVAGMASCDNVEPADRYIELPSVQIARKVLVQEFTGIKCSNCPTGAMTLSEIQKANEGSVIAVSMHPSGTTFSGPMGNFNLNSDEADVYYAAYNPMGFPAILVDGGSPETNISAWGGLVDAALGNPAPAEISLSNTYDSSKRELTVDYEVVFNSGYSGNLNMNLWLVENGIIGPQLSGSAWIPQYTHNHALRASLTGDWGISIGSGFHLDDVRSGSVTYTLPEEYVAENCLVVAFIQNDSHRVEQCEEAHVIQHQEE